ncbi:MAG: elongation factor Ts [Patescibacteria group bacterium]|nr:elongation factor Ts [Patescibacteria group bacterium]
MSNIKMEDIKKLREMCGAGFMDCKKALDEANGNFDEAVKLLKKRGQEIMAKKAGREANEGIIECYVHANKKIGSMVEILCETDFVARNSDFIQMAHDIAIQVAASNPICISPEEVPAEKLEELKKEWQEEINKMGKPKEIADKIMEGKVKKYCEENALTTQALVKDPEKTVQELLVETTAKLGEKLVIKRFTRFEI